MSLSCLWFPDPSQTKIYCKTWKRGLEKEYLICLRIKSYIFFHLKLQKRNLTSLMVILCIKKQNKMTMLNIVLSNTIKFTHSWILWRRLLYQATPLYIPWLHLSKITAGHWLLIWLAQIRGAGLHWPTACLLALAPPLSPPFQCTYLFVCKPFIFSNSIFTRLPSFAVLPWRDVRFPSSSDFSRFSHTQASTALICWMRSDLLC